MTWKERWIGIPLAIAGGLLALTAIAAVLLTRTLWGHEQVRALLTEKLLPRLQGQVVFGSFAGGDLLRGVRFTELRVLDPDGELVLAADTVDLEYDWHDFLGGDVVIRSARLVRPTIALHEDRQGRWSFERAFATRPLGRPEAKERGRRSRLEFRNVTILQGVLSFRTPVDGPGGLFRTERDSEGTWQHFVLEELETNLATLRLSGEPILIRIAELQARAHLTETPASVRGLRADVEVLGDSVSFDVFQLVFPDSRVFGHGMMHFRDTGLELDLALRGERVSFADVTWLVPWLPPPGRGVFDLHLETRPQGLGFAFENADVRLGASRLFGRLGFLLRDDGEVHFEGLDVGLDPLETRWVDTLTRDTLFFAGGLRGRVRGDGPLRQMALESDLTLEPEDGGAPSRVTASGVLAWDGSFGGNPLEMEFDPIDVEVVKSLLAPDLPLRGQLRGRASFRGTLLTGLETEADLVHTDAGIPFSHLTGGGRVIGVEDPRVALQIEGDPLSLTALARYYPALPFRGELRGPVTLRGTFDDLEVNGRWSTARGGLVLRGRFDLAGTPKRYVADLEGEEVQVANLRPGVPRSNLDFRAHLEGAGLEPEELSLRGWVEVLPSDFAGVRLDGGFVRLRAEDGVLSVDSAHLASEAGSLRARGTFGLREDREGTLTFHLKVDTLATWNRWVVPPDTIAPGPTFADGEGALSAFAAEPSPGAAGGPLSGRAELAGSLSGNLGRVDLEGRAQLSDPSWGGAEAAEVTVAWSAEGPPRALRLDARIDGRDVHAFGFEASTSHLDVAWAGDTVQFGAEWVREPEARIRTEARLVRLPDGVELAVQSLDASILGRALLLRSPFTVVRRAQTFWVESFELSGPLGTVRGEAEIPEAGATTLALSISGFDLKDIAALAPDLPPASGALRLDLRLAGSTRSPAAQFEVAAEGGTLAGVAFSRLAARGRFAEGDLRLEASAWRDQGLLFEASGHVPLDLDLGALSARRSEQPIEIGIRAEAFPLAFALARFEQFRDVDGQLRGEIKLRGSFEEPDLDGEIRLTGGSARLPKIGVRYFGAQGLIRFRGEVAEIEEVTVRGPPEGGRGRARGTVRLRPLSNPGFDVTFTAERLLTYHTRIARTVVSGTAELKGVYLKPEITGTLTVETGALFVREIERQREIIDLADPAFFNIVDTTLAEGRRLLPLITDPFFQNMTVNLTLRLTRDSWLRARDRAIEIAGDLQLFWDRAQQDLRISGTLEALRGEYTYYGKRFTVEGRRIEFVGTPGVNPDLDLVARHMVQTRDRPLTIRIHVTGTLENPKIRLTSDAQPPLDESALLSYLLFGRPFSELTRTAGDGRAPEVVSAVGESVLDVFTSELEALLVSDVGLVDYLNISGGRRTDPTYRGEENGVGLATRVEAGSYLAPDVFVTVGQRFGGTRRSEFPDVRLDWRVTRNLTLQFVSEERGPRLETAPRENPTSERSLGLFFFHEWGY